MLATVQVIFRSDNAVRETKHLLKNRYCNSEEPKHEFVAD